MVIVTHESYDSVLVGMGKQKGLESLSENRPSTGMRNAVAIFTNVVATLSHVLNKLLRNGNKRCLLRSFINVC